MPVPNFMNVIQATSRMNYMSFNKSISRESRSSSPMPSQQTGCTSGSRWCTSETDGSRSVQIWYKASAISAPTLTLTLTKWSRVFSAGSYRTRIESRGNYWKVSKRGTTLTSEVRPHFNRRPRWAARLSSNQLAYRTWSSSLRASFT